MTKLDRFSHGLVAGVLFGIGGFLGIYGHPIYILIFAVPAFSIGMKASRGY